MHNTHLETLALAGLTKLQIRDRLQKNGYPTLQDFEKAHGLRAADCSVALNRRFPSVDRLIASAVKLSLYSIWPQRYDERGRPLKGARSRKERLQKRSVSVRPAKVSNEENACADICSAA